VDELLKKYPGLNKDDLDINNPEYSCIICKDVCFFQGCSQHACQSHVEMTTEEWNGKKSRSSTSTGI
jgi:hypothetical protein